MIEDWANTHGFDLYVYHPYQFGHLPSAAQTDMLVILGGPMSPNDDLPWIHQERQLIRHLLAQNKPLFGVCFGAQQITKALGGTVTKSPVKEVGWAPVYRRTTLVRGVPLKVNVLHWHEEMFTLPAHAQLLFSGERVENQGFVLNHRVVGLQFHLEPRKNNVREMVVNDYPYLIDSVIHQTAQEIVDHPIPRQNRQVLFQLLDYISS